MDLHGVTRLIRCNYLDTGYLADRGLIEFDGCESVPPSQAHIPERFKYTSSLFHVGDLLECHQWELLEVSCYFEHV